MIWSNKLNKVVPFNKQPELPNYGFQFFFQNIDPFKKEFILLTVVSIFSTLLNFLAFKYIFANIISTLETMKFQTFVTLYLPVFAGSLILIEVFDYFTRKYADAFQVVYIDTIRLKLFNYFVKKSGQSFTNYSKEKLLSLVSRYLEGVNRFLSDWFWNTSRKMVQFVIVCIIFYIQSPFILLMNLLYFAVFFVIAYNLSNKYSKYSLKYSKQRLEHDNTEFNFFLNLNTIKRVGSFEYFVKYLSCSLLVNWESLSDMRDFHAKRWFIQLNLMRITYVVSITFAVYQVINGILPVGFLILLQSAYSELVGILIYSIELFIALLQQKANAELVRGEFEQFNNIVQNKSLELGSHAKFNRLELKDIRCNLIKESGENLTISIDYFVAKESEKIGILGESGSGKSTVLNILLNQIEFEGSYTINDKLIESNVSMESIFSIVNSTDPLFHITIRENLLLNSNYVYKIEKVKLEEVLNKLFIDEFCQNLEERIGDKSVNYSLGQFQRLRIARGILQDKEIYLFDEPFNGLDNEKRIKIKEFVKQKLQNKTVIFISHNPQDLDWMDRIYTFQGHSLIK